YPTSQFKDAVARRASELASQSDRPAHAKGVTLGPLNPEIDGDTIRYRSVTGGIDRSRRVCDLTVAAPGEAKIERPRTPEEFEQAGDQAWAIRAFRELDDAILRLRLNEPEIGVVVIRTKGDPRAVLEVDATLEAHQNH